MSIGESLDRLKPLQNQRTTDGPAAPRANPYPADAAAVGAKSQTRFQSQDPALAAAIRSGVPNVDAPNDWGYFPSFNMEARGWIEALDVQTGSGTIILDVSLYNSFYVIMDEDALIQISGAPAIPPGQPDRNRVVPINLAVKRNGHQLTFGSGIKWPGGEYVIDGRSDSWDDFAFKGMIGPGIDVQGGIWFGYDTGQDRR